MALCSFVACLGSFSKLSFSKFGFSKSGFSKKVFQEFGFGELARGGWGNQGEGARGAVDWTLFVNDNSKTPAKQSLVREHSHTVHLALQRRNLQHEILQLGRSQLKLCIHIPQ